MLDVALSREYGWQVQPHTRPYVLTRLVMQIGSARWTAGLLFLSGEARVQTRSTAEGRQDHIEDRTAAGPLEQQLALIARGHVKVRVCGQRKSAPSTV